MFGDQSGGRRRRRSAGGGAPYTPPGLEDLPTDWPPLAWKIYTPRRQFAFQPCAGCCNCTLWTDTFERESIGEDWAVSSGQWSIDDIPGGGKQLCSVGAGAILTSRRLNAGYIEASINFSANQTVRVYFDWTDSTHNQYAEFTCGDEEPADDAYGHESGLGTISIYRVDGGEPVLLAGPDDWPATPSVRTVAVQYFNTNTPGQKYVQAIADVAEEITNTTYWASTLAEFYGTECGIGVDDTCCVGVFHISDCDMWYCRTCTTQQDYSYWEIYSTYCFYARPCGLTVNTGTLVSGDWSTTGKIPIVLQPSDGTVDVVFSVYYRKTNSPRYVEVVCDNTSGPLAKCAVWNFVTESWDETQVYIFDPDDIDIDDVAQYAIHQAVTSEHVDEEGRVGFRLVFGTSENVTIHAVRGCRTDSPLPNSMTVTLDGDWHGWGGTYELIWAPDEPYSFVNLRYPDIIQVEGYPLGYWAYKHYKIPGVESSIDFVMYARFMDFEDFGGDPWGYYEYPRIDLHVSLIHEVDEEFFGEHISGYAVIDGSCDAIVSQRVDCVESVTEASFTAHVSLGEA